MKIFGCILLVTLAMISAGECASRESASEISVAQVTATRLAVWKAVRRIRQEAPRDRGQLLTFVERAAQASAVPSDFFRRLIHQESAFDPNAVSSKGAQGVAQFMPATAAQRGLKNPFDPEEALVKSAELLKDLKNRFGNWGLAAAAYNAGPERVRRWLAGASRLPAETQNYVRIITGRVAEEWAQANPEFAFSASPAVVRKRARRQTQQEAELLILDTVRGQSQATMVSTRTPGRSGDLCTTCIRQKIY
ncbi:lytic transglycosylase domain-containing protein [Rhodopseudomonas telluris]|uniref:Lytic transglycosylase domain-containing protein n=1 Tax=Rhodopseudomonas telluris TaxID=644215 RepID=A0ABV6ELS5_9BRAD